MHQLGSSWFMAILTYFEDLGQKMKKTKQNKLGHFLLKK